MSNQRIKISMHEFKEYIKNMESLVSNIVHYNRVFSEQILELEDYGWRDDVYIDTRNCLFSLQGVTNEFINRLESIDNDLITGYCKWYENYWKKDYVRITLDMERVELIPEQTLKDDEETEVSTEAIAYYIDSTNAYVINIRNELQDFEGYHLRFSDYFQTIRYEDLSVALKEPLAEMEEILADIEFLVGEAKKKLDHVIGW